MILPANTYAPSLRWRQGEYQALLEMPERLKERIVPLITIPPIEYDFEAQAPKKSPHEHVHPFPLRLKKKWGERLCWIDMHSSLRSAVMNDGQKCYDYVFSNLRIFSAHGVPVVSMEMDADTIATISNNIANDQHGVGIRVGLEDLMGLDFDNKTKSLLSRTRCDYSDADLIIDLGAPNFEPIDAFQTALTSLLGNLQAIEKFRNLVFIGTAIPESMGDISQVGASLPRWDWILYQKLLDCLEPKIVAPIFGDYTITHPDFVALDMRKIKAPGKVVYTTEKSWEVLKGGAFRDNPEQMHDHCKAIVDSKYFRGPDFSPGDKYIAKCAEREVGPSNLTRWKRVGVNHHMSVVLDDLANLHGVA